MLSAEWCAVMVFRGRETDSYQTSTGKRPAQSRPHTTLIRGARELGKEIEVRPLPAESGEIGEAEKIKRPFSYDHRKRRGEPGRDLPGMRKKELDEAEGRLLRALASHAALSLENFRRFSQLERSKRQWVEDIDAISDYIVVHDRSWRIVRTNRSLASHLGVPPVALVGEAMNSLRRIAETGSDLPCPFCRDTQQPREEYVVASPERIFLVSTSAHRGSPMAICAHSRFEGHYRSP